MAQRKTRLPQPCTMTRPDDGVVLPFRRIDCGPLMSTLPVLFAHERWARHTDLYGRLRGRLLAPPHDRENRTRHDVSRRFGPLELEAESELHHPWLHHILEFAKGQR
jgi:hypothetical protein